MELYALHYVQCLAQDDKEWTVCIESEVGARIKLRVPTSDMLVRRGNTLVFPRWLLSAKGIEHYAVPAAKTSEFSLGDTAKFRNGLYVLRSLKSGKLMRFCVSTSELSATWVYKGCRIFAIEAEQNRWESVGVVIAESYRAFGTISDENRRLLRFFSDFLLDPATATDRVEVVRTELWCLICNGPSQTPFCGDSCRIKAGVS